MIAPNPRVEGRRELRYRVAVGINNKHKQTAAQRNVTNPCHFAGLIAGLCVLDVSGKY